jgi:predicted dehydrogenase
MIRVGVIGYGHWGPNLVRNFAELDDAAVAAVADHHPERLELLERRHPGIRTYLDHAGLLRDPSIDAVAIATPISSHFDLAMAALAAGKHVWVEKPITETLEQARRLADEADRRKRVLVVDHTLVYSGGVRKLAELIDAGELGRIVHFDATRVNLGIFRDVNVIADLGVHDFAILDHLVKERPVAVSATGAAHFAGVPEDVANVTIFYDSGTIAHVGLSWIAPIRFRQVLVGGSRKMAVYHETDATEPIKVYDKGVALHPDAAHPGRQKAAYRSGDMWAPKVDGTGALRQLSQHFVDCIRNGNKPLTDARMGARMVELIEAATRSMGARGAPVELTQPGDRG